MDSLSGVEGKEKTEVYQAVCRTLSGQLEDIDWPAFRLADWELLQQVAQSGGIAPFVYWRLREYGWPGTIPETVRSSLHTSYYGTARRNLLLSRELKRVLKALADVDVQAIVLKGANLDSTLYPRIGLRPMADLDLLVPQAQLSQAKEAVLALGYVPEGIPEIGPGVSSLIHYEANFDGGVHIPAHVELHWNLTGGQESYFQPDIDWFWQHTRRANLFGVQSLALEPTAQLLHLASHLILKHGEGGKGRLIWFYDMHLLVDRYREHIDWEELLTRSREFHWEIALSVALEGIQTRFHTSLPNGFVKALRENDGSRSLAYIRRKVNPQQTRILRIWNQLGSLSWKARLRWALALVFPSPDYMRWRYRPRPALLWPVCYILRWLDVLGDGVKTLIGLLRQGEQGCSD